MIAIIQAIVSLLLTALYAIYNDVSFALLDVFKIVLLFFIINIGLVILVLLLFVAFIYLTEKTSPKNRFKNAGFHHFNVYVFNFLYRVKPIFLGKENLPKDNNFVLYSNHVEYTDPLYILQAYKKYNLAFISKEELFKYPLVKNALRSTGAIPLSRKTGDRQALQAVLQAIKQVKGGQPVAIFPEGTRNHGNTIKDFKSGSFRLPQKAGADISPVVLFNMHKTVDIFKIFKAKVYIKILPVIKYEEFKDMDTSALSTYVHDKIYEELCAFKEK